MQYMYKIVECIYVKYVIYYILFLHHNQEILYTSFIHRAIMGKERELNN